MNLLEKVGQLLIVGIPGPTLTPDVAKHLKRWHVGGVILFARNLPTATDAQKLTSDLNQLLSTKEKPLWVCVDQEGGVVVRLTRDVSVFPGNMALGATQNPSFAYEVGKATALEWGPLGINVNLAPVLDLSYAENPGIGVRSLGEDPNKVATLGEKLIQGMQDQGLCATAKHFPGKGLARLDSHLDLPVIDAPLKKIEETELLPFERAIEAGVLFVMTSHCVFSCLDPKVPATLSRKILTNLLREKCGFQGLVISDDLEMGAILKHFPVEEAAFRFLKAGGDQILVCHTVEAQDKVFNRIVKAVQQNEIRESEIDKKVERILKNKQIWQNKTRKGDRPAVLSKNESLSLEVARNSITIIKNEENLIPIQLQKDQNLLAVCVDYTPLTLVEEVSSEKDGLKSLLSQFHPNLTFKTIPSEVPDEMVATLISETKNAEMIVLFTYNAHRSPTQADFVRKCLERGKPTIVCALRNPYDINAFPEVKHFVASYGWRCVSLKALVEVLFGKIKASGNLPVGLS